MRILIATDAWRPQVNGVLHTLEANAQAAKALGAEVVFLNPEGFPSVGMPSYPGIRLALPRRREIFCRIADIGPDAIHIATEGPIGHFARWYCVTNRRPFTTSFHTRFTDYAAARFPVPEGWTWTWLRWFHNAGRGTMVSTASLAQELRMRGFHTVLRWPRGVDSRLFHPDRARDLSLPRPVFLTVGRLAVEKNVEAFLGLDLPGSKVVVGDGPARDMLARRFPNAAFLGTRRGAELVERDAGEHGPDDARQVELDRVHGDRVLQVLAVHQRRDQGLVGRSPERLCEPHGERKGQDDPDLDGVRQDEARQQEG